jgi:hypothetical protein
MAHTVAPRRHKILLAKAKGLRRAARAVVEAGRLVQAAMQARGFPVAGDFEKRAADLSVNYPTWWSITAQRTRLRFAIRTSRWIRRIFEQP